jgi:hypothetical protein
MPFFVVKQWVKSTFLLFQELHRISDIILKVSFQESLLFKAHNLASLSYRHFSLPHQPALNSFTIPPLNSFCGPILKLQLDVLVKCDIISQLQLILYVTVHQSWLIDLISLLWLHCAHPGLRRRPHNLLSLPWLLLVVGLWCVRFLISCCTRGGENWLSCCLLEGLWCDRRALDTNYGILWDV